jgi:hypothetical protein
MKTKKIITGLLIVASLMSLSKALNAQQNVQVTSTRFIAYSLYNFSKLIDWPNSSSATVFSITVVGDQAVYQELLDLAKNRKVCNATYDIKLCKKPEEINGRNQIIYLSNMYSGKVKNLSEDPGLQNVLLVTEREGMASYGSAISFTVTEKGTMGFAIAKENAKKNQLTIRSQLERMAIEVL